MPAIVTERLVLRPWTVDDLGSWRALHTDPEVVEFIGDGTVPDEATIATRLGRAAWAWEQHGLGLFACEQAEPAWAGAVGFVGFTEPAFLPELLPAFEIGWRLRRQAWGKGLAAEAATAALTWAFDADLVDRVVSCIQVGNRRSVRLAERLGMRPRHRTVVPAHRRWVDVYELTKAEWEPER